MAKQIIWEPGTTFKDWLLLPGRLRRKVAVDSVDLRTPITSYCSETGQELTPDQLPEDVFVMNMPMLSAPMQSVTGSDMAIELAKTGGLGVIFCSQPIDEEARMVVDVKKYKAGFVTPDVFSPQTTIAEIATHTRKKGYSTFPITDDGKPDGVLIGLLTGKDYSETRHMHLTAADRMKQLGELVASYEDEIGGDLAKANEILEDSHHGSMPIVSRDGRLKAMVFKRDIQHHLQNPLELVDSEKRYRVGAAINTHDYAERVPELVAAGADIIFIDSSQGFSDYQEGALRFLRETFSNIPVVGGNIVTEEGFDSLVNNGAHCIKIGMGPGSICTTREKYRMGRAQATAVIKLNERRQQYLKEKGVYVPIIADGGIVTNDDVWVALALGADAIMAGRVFARFDESPPKRTELRAIRDGMPYTADVKPYWGEGSERAQKWREKRYGQSNETEGIEGAVPYAGHLNESMPRIINSIRTAMQKGGFGNIYELHANAVLERESESSRTEGRPHDISGPGVWSNYSMW